MSIRVCGVLNYKCESCSVMDFRAIGEAYRWVVERMAEFVEEAVED